MLPRFLAADLDPASGSATLSAEETHHLTHVLRLRFGDEIAIFDGNGHEYRARVERVTRDGAVVRLIEAITPTPEPAVRLTLAQALLKGEKMDAVVRDATMMGVGAIEPILSAHAVVRSAALADGRMTDRWRRIAIASAKQCRRAVLPIVGSGTALDDYVAQDGAATRLMLVEPSAAIEGYPVSALKGERPAAATLLVGPEGGWSEAEVAAATRAGWVPISLGRRTLRADAVAVVAIGVLQFVWGDL